jgi:hypothetical protein
MFTGATGVPGVLAVASLLLLVACGGTDEVVPLGDADAAEPGGDVQPHGELELVPGSDVTVQGVIVANSMDPCLLPDHDEPCVMDLGGVLTLGVDGNEVSVHYGGGEWPPCENPPAIRQGEEARVGMRATVYAEVADVDHFSGADLDTCSSGRYSIETTAAP